MYNKPPVCISVIMGVYNQLNAIQLEKAVDSILNQTFRDFEFIIYDDGSIPEVSRQIKSLEKKDERIVVIGSEINNGLGFSLNRCLEAASGRFIARMDADDESLPFRFETQVEFMENHPEYDWCGTNAILFDDLGEWEHTTRPEVPTVRDFLRYSPYIHPSVMYRSSLFKEEHKADRRYSEIKEALRCEDYEIFIRLTKLGYKGYNIQRETIKYRVDRKNYHKRPFKVCVNEARIRYRSFKDTDESMLTKVLCIMRPIVSGFLPVWLIKALKDRGKL